MSDAIGGIAQMLGNIGGQLISNAGTARQNRKNRAFQADENQKSRDFAQSMFDQTNEFNLRTSDPAFIMQRYKNAGMNPWLVYGEPTSVKADSTSPSGVSALPPGQNESHYDLGSVVKDFYNLMSQKAQIKNIEADTAKKESEASVADATTGAVVQDTNQKAQLFGGQMDLQTANVGLTKNQSDKVLKEIEAVGAQTNLSNQQTKNLKQDVANKMVEAENLRKQGKLIDAQRAEKEAGNMIINATAQSKIDAENARNKFDAQTSGIGKTNAWNLTGSLVGAAIEAIKAETKTVKKNYNDFKNSIPDGMYRDKNGRLQWKNKNYKTP